jgi:hypothetical protein
MKKVLLIVLVLGFYYCTKINPDISDNDITGAMYYFMDSIVAKSRHLENYSIIPNFDGKLSDKDFLILDNDSLFTKENVIFIMDQYDKLKQRNIKDFLSEKYLLKFNSNEPENNGQVSYHLDPPLFTKDKERFIIYFKIFFWDKDEIKWNDFFVICKRNNSNWILESIIKSATSTNADL